MEQGTSYDSALDELTEWTLNNSNRIKEGIRKSGNSYKLLELTADGKRYRTTKNMSDLVGFLGANGKEDDLGEALRALMMMAGDDPAEIAQGIAIAGSMTTPGLFFGDAAFETGYVLRTMLVDDDGILRADDFLMEMDEIRRKLICV